MNDEEMQAFAKMNLGPHPGISLGDPDGIKQKKEMVRVCGMVIGSYGNGYYVEGKGTYQHKDHLKNNLCGNFNGANGYNCWFIMGKKKSELECWISSLQPSPSVTPHIAWTDEQEKIFSFFLHGEGHGCIKAVAGSGKTTTLIEGIRRYAEGHKGAKFFFTTFAKKNIEDAKVKLERIGLADRVECRTLHSAGMCYFLDQRKMDVGHSKKGTHKAGTGSEWNLIAHRLNADHFQKKNTLARKLPSSAKLSSIERNALVKTACAAQEQLIKNLEDGDELFDLVGGELATNLELQEKIRGLLPDFLNKCAADETVDFQDMIWAPYYQELEPNFPLQFDFVIIDEIQDLNPAQVELVKRIVRYARGENGQAARLVIVGDPNQSVYGFRGAKNALSLFEKDFKLHEGQLTVTQRCPTSHVQLACQMNPQIRAAAVAPKGTWGFMDLDEFNQHVEKENFVLCRWNKPLIQACFNLVKEGKPCVIVGESEIGKDMLAMTEDFCIRYQDSQTTENLAKFLENLKDRETAVAIKRQAFHRLLLISDYYETFLWLLGQFYDLGKFTAFIKDVFVGASTKRKEEDYKQEEYISFTSVHRAKGREAKTVFILSPSQFLSPPQQRPEYFDDLRAYEEERNLLYVALTRSLECLIFVQNNPDDVFHERFQFNVSHPSPS